MAFLGLKVPHETARLLGQIKVEGDKVDLSEMHITLMYLGKGLPIEAITAATEVAFAVTSKTRPFTVRTELVTSFPQNPDSGIPIIARIESDALHSLRDALTAAFDAAGVSYDKKYPEFKPHVTLAYKTATGDSEAGIEAPKDQRIPSLEWGIGELVLWGGDSGDEKLSVTFPFALTLSKQAAYRAFVRIAAHKRSCGGPMPTSGEGKSCGCDNSCSCMAERVASRYRTAVTEKELSPDVAKSLAHLSEKQLKDLTSKEAEVFAKGLDKIRKDPKGKGKNPYVYKDEKTSPEKPFCVTFLAPNSRGEMRVYDWTGDSLKQDRPETQFFKTEKEAESELRSKVLQEIRRYHPGDDIFILGW